MCAISRYPRSDVVRSNACSPSLRSDWGLQRGDVIGLYAAMQLWACSSFSCTHSNTKA